MIDELLGRWPDSLEYATLLQELGAAKRLEDGRRVHRHICKRGYDGDTFLGNLVAQMYGRCGKVSLAKKAFDRIKKPDLFSWNIMIQAYAQCRDIDNAKQMFDSMPKKNVISWNVMLSAFSDHGLIREAEELFKTIPDRSCRSWNAMLAAYTGNGHLERAMVFFRLIPCKNVVTWNAMVAAFAQAGKQTESLEVFWMMNLDGVKANTVTVICVLEACVDLKRGRTLHALILSANLNSDLKVTNALIHMYGRCRDLQRAKELFEHLPNPSIVSWTAMIGAHAQNGDLDRAAELFQICQEKSVVTWNSMISGYVRNDLPVLAIRTFMLMDLDGEAPNSASFVSALDACCCIGSLLQTKIIHEAAVDCSFDKNTAVATALVTAYGKCGSVETSMRCFESIPRKDTVAWSAMAATYAHNGHGLATLEIFYSMVQRGIQPDGVVFVSVLAACSHGGELRLGLQCFASITADYGFEPWRDHYLCLVDLATRCGDLESSLELIEAVELEVGVSIYQTMDNIPTLSLLRSNLIRLSSRSSSGNAIFITMTSISK